MAIFKEKRRRTFFIFFGGNQKIGTPALLQSYIRGRKAVPCGKYAKYEICKANLFNHQNPHITVILLQLTIIH